MNKRQIKYRADWALEIGTKHNELGIIEDAKLVLGMVRNRAISIHEIINSKAYTTIVRIWSRSPIL